ncbi:hypothetical protein ACNKHN_08595 [Shigella flexneri]
MDERKTASSRIVLIHAVVEMSPSYVCCWNWASQCTLSINIASKRHCGADGEEGETLRRCGTEPAGRQHLVIAYDNKALAMGGIFGGATSGG